MANCGMLNTGPMIMLLGLAVEIVAIYRLNGEKVEEKQHRINIGSDMIVNVLQFSCFIMPYFANIYTFEQQEVCHF